MINYSKLQAYNNFTNSKLFLGPAYFNFELNYILFFSYFRI